MRWETVPGAWPALAGAGRSQSTTLTISPRWNSPNRSNSLNLCRSRAESTYNADVKESSVNAEFLVRMGRFLDNELSFAELVDWVQDREEHWAAQPVDSVARILAGTLMLASYEVDDGARDVESVKELLSEATLQPAR
jgi:hypothetical protein